MRQAAVRGLSVGVMRTRSAAGSCAMHLVCLMSVPLLPARRHCWPGSMHLRLIAGQSSPVADLVQQHDG